MNRTQKLTEILANLQLVVSDLIPVIVAYQLTLKWNQHSGKCWDMEKNPWGIINDGSYLYVCIRESDKIIKYHNNDVILYTLMLTEPSGIDYNQKEGRLYIASREYVTVLNTNFIEINSWKIKVNTLNFYRCIKVDGNRIFLAVDDNQIYIFNKNGTLLEKWGVPEGSSKPGEFEDPRGIEIDKECVYIVDGGNHRIQKFTKEGKYIHHWGTQGTEKGQFYFPNSIYSELFENLIYIGDSASVQSYLKTNPTKFIQRITNRCSSALFISVMNDRLYICDCGHTRIQVFER